MNVNISSWIQRNATIFADKLALKDERHQWTYRELEQRVGCLAHGLQAKGVEKGARVASLLPNCVEMIELLFACARIGALYVPLNWRLGEDELVFICEDCTPDLLVTDERWTERAETIVARVKAETTHESQVLLVGDSPEASDYEALLASQSVWTGEIEAAGGEDAVKIIYTSGTTGDPKGVVLTHANTFWQTINGWSLGVSPSTVCLVLLPLFHVGGLNGSVTPMLHIGATVVLQQKFDPGVVLQSIEEDHVTGVLGVPTIYRMLAEHPNFASTDLSQCDVLLSGGASLPMSIIETYQARGLEFRQGYGLTEASPGVTGMGPGECVRKAGSAGRQILYTEVRIVDDNGEFQPTGEVGEVVVRGPNVMKGYWKRPEETAKVLRNGWLHTGDIGKFDEDGFLYIVDRKKDMIISGGENIFPAEIEKLLADHPAVQQATVVAGADEKWGEIPVAVVVPHETGLDAQVLKDFLASKLARYKRPKAYHFVSSLPLNASGKVVKAEVRKQLGLV